MLTQSVTRVDSEARQSLGVEDAVVELREGTRLITCLDEPLKKQ